MPTPDFPGKPEKPGLIKRVFGFVKSQVEQPKTVDLSGDTMVQINTGVTTRVPRQEINKILQASQPEGAQFGPLQILNYSRTSGAAPDAADILPALPNRFYRIKRMSCNFVPNITAAGGAGAFVLFATGGPGTNLVLAMMGRGNHNPILAVALEESLPVAARIHESILSNGILNVRILFQVGSQ